MSGHSKWANIKNRKQAMDKKRGGVFSKMAKIVTIAARKGGDPEMNPALRLAILKAKSVNMPNDNIERAIKKGTGEDKSGQLEEIIYEAYGPGGTQLIIELITDNKNRTLSEIRHILSQYGGRLVEGGGVKWNFNQMGVISIKYQAQNIKKDDLELMVIDAGAEDIKWKPASSADEDNILEIYTKPENLEKIKEKIKNIEIEESGLEWIPKNEVKIEDESIKKQLEKLFETLDENEDVKEIYSNVNPDTLS